MPHITHSSTGVLRGTLLKAIESNTPGRLATLSLSDVGDEDLEILGKAVESGNLSALTTLACYGASGHKTLANAMASGHILALETLCLSDGNMGDEVCEAFAAAISAGKLPCLKNIVFPGNHIGNRGAQALGRAMRLADLSSLNLGRNEIGDEGLIALADSFHTVFSDVDRLPAFRRLQDLIVERNERMRAILEKLDGFLVPATFSKVCICGNPEVGKTTLRKTLQRSLWTSRFRCERKPHVEPTTDRCLYDCKQGKQGR
ncbi:unnamed protein product [Calypogeia fissa]